MVYLYDAFDQISDFSHQQLLRKMRRKISWTDGRTDRGKTVYPPPLREWGYNKLYIFRQCTNIVYLTESNRLEMINNRKTKSA